MGSQEDSIYESISGLLQNIELNRRTLLSIIVESLSYREDPRSIVFYLFAKLLNVETIDVGQCHDSLLLEDEEEVASNSANSHNTIPNSLSNNIFLNDEFLTNWINTEHPEIPDQLLTLLDNLGAETNADKLSTLLSLSDSDLTNYITELYSRVIDNVFALDRAHSGSETRAEAFVGLIFEITMLCESNIAFNLKLFVLEAYYQLAILSPVNKLLLSQSRITDIMIKELAMLTNNVVESGYSMVYFQAIFRLYLVIAEVGSVDYTLFIDFLRKIIMLNDKTPKTGSSFKEALFVRFFQNLLDNFEKLSASSNISATHFSKTTSLETQLMPNNFLVFPSSNYVTFNNLKLSEDAFTLQMWLQFTYKDKGQGEYVLVDSLHSSYAKPTANGSVPFVNLINCKQQTFWQLLFNKNDHSLVLHVADENKFSVHRKFTNFSLEFSHKENDTSLDSPDESDTEGHYLKTKFYNIVLIHKFNSRDKHDKFKPSRVHLIVDGQFLQSVFVPMSRPPTYKSDISVQFGNMSTPENCYVSFNNLLLINKIQPHQWIILNYFLGFNYHHNYKDLNLINKFLGYKTLSLFELKSRELKLNYDQGMADDNEDHYEAMNSGLINHSLKNDSTGILNRSFGKIQKKLPPKSVAFNLNFVLVGDDSILLNFHARNVVHKSGIKLHAKPDAFGQKSYVLNTVFNSVNNLELNSDFLGISTNDIVYYQSGAHTLSNFFNSTDGITILLKLIESVNANTDDADELRFGVDKLVILLKTLFSLISQNHVFAREMEEKGGYHILSIILKNKKKLCRLKVLDTILQFVGYDHLHPIESVIVNSVGYKSLIVDFDIWKDTDKETFKFLLFQFTVFSQDSRYHEYNVNKIVKMKIIKRFVQCLKSNVFTENFLPSVSNTLLILIKSNPTAEIFHSLSTYIIYALQINKNYTSDPNLVPIENQALQRKCGICILELLVHIVSNSPSQSIFRKIIKSITIRWIVLLMDDSHEDIVKIALKLLIKMFSMLGIHFYTNFISNNGFNILKNLLKKWYSDDELTVIIFAASFGASQLDNLGDDIYEYAKRLARRNDLKVSMPEFLYLMFDFMESSIEANCNVPSYERFIQCVQFSFKHITCLHTTFKKKQWISKMCLIVHKLELQGAPEMQNILTEFKQALANIILSIIYSTESFMTIESFQADIIAKRVLTGVIYPSVLKEIKILIQKDDSRLRKKTVCKNVCKFLLQCADSTNKFIWERPDLLALHKALALFVEQYSNRYEPLSSTLKALKRYLGVLTLERMFILVYALTEENRGELKELVDTLLYNQEMYFSREAMDVKRLHILVVFLLQAVKEDSVRGDTSNTMNALRILFMHRQSDFDKVSYCINSVDSEPILDFFESLLVSSDDLIIQKLHHDNFLRASLEKTLFNCFEKFENTFFNVLSVKDVLRSLKQPELDSTEVKLFINFRTENVNWKSSIILSEMAKYYRHFQDQQDNFQFFISNFNKMKLEVSRILFKTKQNWVVDNIESVDRIRKRVVPKDDLSSEDQLLYKIDVPVVDTKPIQEPYSLISTQMELLNMEEDFELVDEAALFDSTQEDKNRKVLRSLFVGDRINDLWNVSQLLGLEAEEGILILGETHLYLIENYFHCDNDEVVDINDAPPESRDPYLKLITGQPKSKRLKKTVKSHNTKSWELDKLTSVSKRQFLLRDVAIEFFFTSGSSFLVICRSSKERDVIHSKFSSRAKNSNIDTDLLLALKSANYTPGITVNTQTNFASKLANVISSNLNGFLGITKKWKAGQISNFYYLMLINTIAGRTFNDLTQYPVFPWVIADYTSKTLDLNNPATFRDLSKPMGAQHWKRAQQFRERYDALKSLRDPPAFHYGTHYSSAMIVTSFLIRLEPYVQSYLLLQGGKFDHADRLFYSVEKAWNSAARDNYADVRELIPEFYYLPEFLVNSSNFQLGQLQNGTTINNVDLPPWANGDPKVFIETQRRALESPYVSAHLHEWIDLVFGYKQRGQAAVDSSNVFHHLSYHGAINLDSIDDEHERTAVTGIIHNFGQTPLQIFTKPHVQRDVHKCPRLEVFRLSDVPHVEQQTKQPVRRLELSSNSNSVVWKGRAQLFSTEDNLKILGSASYSSLSVNGRVFENLHSGNINVLVPIGERSFMTGSDDGTINIWKFPVRASRFVTFNSSPVLSQLRFQEELEYKGVLRGHLGSIVDIKISKSYNVAVTLDSLGIVYMWDLVRYKLIRDIDVSPLHGKTKHINISNVSGIVGLASDFTVCLYTVNGDYITSETVKEKVTSIAFPEKKKLLLNSFDQCRLEENHEFWNDTQIVLIASTRGIALYSLEIINTNWSLHAIANLKVRNKDGEIIMDTAITCVELVLKSKTDDKGNVYGTAEIVAGDSNGRVILWS